MVEEYNYLTVMKKKIYLHSCTLTRMELMVLSLVNFPSRFYKMANQGYLKTDEELIG